MERDANLEAPNPRSWMASLKEALVRRLWRCRFAWSHASTACFHVVQDCESRKGSFNSKSRLSRTAVM